MMKVKNLQVAGELKAWLKSTLIILILPFFLTYTDTEYDKDGKEKSKGLKTEQINDAQAFWTRSKSDIKRRIQ